MIGTTGLGEIVSHIYEKAGTYDVYLNVTDDEGAKGSYNTSAQILENTLPSMPKIIGTLVCDNTTTFYEYSFISNDLDNDTIRYTVDWGDGSDVVTTEFLDNNTASMLRHIWDTPGIYTMKVFAQDSYKALSDTAQVIVSVDVDLHYYSIDTLKGYFMDYYKDGSIDAFHNDETGTLISLQPDENGWYLLDANGDGIYEYRYHKTQGLQANLPSDETGESNWFIDNIIFIIILVIVCIVVTFIIFFRFKQK